MKSAFIPKIPDESKIKDYVLENGVLYNVTSVDRIRDAGTGVIETNKEYIKFYIHKVNHTVHNQYPPNDENMVTDELTLNYLSDRLDVYSRRLVERVEREKNSIREWKKYD